MRLNKIYKKNCIGRVPSSIRDLEECALCENEELCMSLMGAAQVVRTPAEEVPRGQDSFSVRRSGES